jgi:hypothetical protein
MLFVPTFSCVAALLGLRLERRQRRTKNRIRPMAVTARTTTLGMEQK